MEFKFEANQEYQLQAIQSITGLFEGQPRIEVDFTGLGDMHAIGNRLDLDEDALLENLWKVQEGNQLEWDEALLPTANRKGGLDLPYHNFSVEMETGTGKTYIYLRTALELYRSYGFRKFIVVVPSVAIREGVMKTLRITEKHFRDLYRNPPYRYYSYDSRNLSQVRQFALSSDMELMVMTIDSFNKDLNVMRQPRERLHGAVAIDLIRATRPILILDEPQTKMEGKKNVQALGELHPLMTLRYSATHRRPYNRVYRLTPFDAYRQRLVKKVSVWGVTQENNLNQAYIMVRDIKAAGRKMQATLNVNKLAPKSGNISRKPVTVKPGDNLYVKTKLPEYQDLQIDRIEYGRVYFAAGMQEIALGAGESIGDDKRAIFKAQIHATIEQHFSRDSELRERGIKVLSLFFIDRVANYSSLFCQMFDEAYSELARRERFAKWRSWRPQDVRAAYFAQSSSRQESWKDTGGESEADKKAYQLIMRDKERLLSFDEPVAFIFSHSALNEGWDNPNIFQICTLRDVKSYTTKRQQIGRGVRLPVNQHGDRIHDEHANVLTVVANESYAQFVMTYQQEIEEIYGETDNGAEIENARERQRIRRRPGFELDPNFRALWDKIKHKTRYSVEIDTDGLIRAAALALKEDLDNRPILPPRVIAVKGAMELADGRDVFRAIATGQRDMGSVHSGQGLPNLVWQILQSLEGQHPPVSLSRQTIMSIIQKSGKLAEGMQNPKAFAMRAARVIRDVLGESLVNGIQYERIDSWYDMSLFDREEFESGALYLPLARKSVYDRIECDSKVECEFVDRIEKREDIALHIKLPPGFKVSTPIGAYNPDWAIVLDARDKEKCYLVRETKGGPEMRPSEERKTQFARKHFDALGLSYEVLNPKDFHSLTC